ncbi:hypothetical protein ATER59S_00354 [Aquamicrobium terrae]
MINQTHSEIETIAGDAGWDSFTLLLLISRWLDANSLSDGLIAHLGDLAAEEEDDDLAGGD